MGDKNKLGLTVIAVILLIGGGVWYFTKGASAAVVKNQAYWVNNIAAYTTKLEGLGNGANINTLNGMGSGYLQAWSDAIDANSNFFVYNNISYSTNTGTAEVATS